MVVGYFFKLLLLFFQRGWISSNLSLFLCLANGMIVSEMSESVPAGSYSVNKTCKFILMNVNSQVITFSINPTWKNVNQFVLYFCIFHCKVLLAAPLLACAFFNK